MIRRTFDTISAYGNRTVKVKWVVPAYLLIALIAFGLREQALNYAEDKVAAAAADVAATELQSCLRRVESRDEIRGMFLTTFDVIEQTMGRSSPALAAARVRLDERYPQLDPAACYPN